MVFLVISVAVHYRVGAVCAAWVSPPRAHKGRRGEPGPVRREAGGASRHQTASLPRLASPDPIRVCVHLPWIGAIIAKDRPLFDTMLLFWTFALIGRAAWRPRAVPPSAVHSDPLSRKPEQRRLTGCIPLRRGSRPHGRLRHAASLTHGHKAVSEAPPRRRSLMTAHIQFKFWEQSHLFNSVTDYRDKLN